MDAQLPEKLQEALSLDIENYLASLNQVK